MTSKQWTMLGTILAGIAILVTIVLALHGQPIYQGDTYQVSSQNQSGGVTAGRIEINHAPSIIFGESTTILNATGTIDDSNTAFTFTRQPSELVINGASYQQTGGAITWTWAAGTFTATLSSPVGIGGSIYGRELLPPRL